MRYSRTLPWCVATSLMLVPTLPFNAIAQAADFRAVFFVQGEQGPVGEDGETVVECDADGCELGHDLVIEGDLEASGATSSGDLDAAEASLGSVTTSFLSVSQSVWFPDCPPGYLRFGEEGVPEHVTLCRRGLDEMVRVGDIWVDRYEASVWESEDCSGTQFGGDIHNWDTIVDVFPYNGQFTLPAFACSVSDVRPSRWLTWFQAQAACAASGKHLLTNAEWQAAVIGTYDPGTSVGMGGTCVTAEGAYRATGEGGACRSFWWVEDMIGNLWEFTSDWYGQGDDGESDHQPPEFNGDGYWNVDAAEYQGEYATHFPPVGWRGGCYNNTSRAGAFALVLGYAPSHRGRDEGFRCARGY